MQGAPSIAIPAVCCAIFAARAQARHYCVNTQQHAPDFGVLSRVAHCTRSLQHDALEQLQERPQSHSSQSELNFDLPNSF
jgi:hypothetical protein